MTARLVVLNPLFYPDLFGGRERALWALCQHMTKVADVRIDVLAESRDASSTPPTQSPVPRITVHREPPADPGRLWRLADLVRVQWWRRRLLTDRQRLGRPHAILANDPASAVAAILVGDASRLVYRPVFCMATLREVAQNVPAMAELTQPCVRVQLDRFAYRHAACVIEQTRNLRDQHTQAYGQRPHRPVIHNGVDRPIHLTPKPAARQALRQTLGLDLPTHALLIGFLGRPGDPCKDLPFLLHAFQHARLPAHAHLVLIGGGNHLDAARQWVNDLPCRAQIHFAGPHDHPTAILPAFDALVLPSRFETFGNVLLEAAAHSVAPIGRRRDPSHRIYTATEELIDHDHTGYCVHATDPGDLARTLARLAADPSLATCIGTQARDATLARSWTHAARAYLLAMAIAAEPASQTSQAAA